MRALWRAPMNPLPCGSYAVPGCQNSRMWNFESAATVDDGSCVPGRDSLGILPPPIRANPCLETGCDVVASFGCKLNSNLGLFLQGLGPDADTWLCSSLAAASERSSMSAAVRDSFDLATAYCAGETDTKGTCLAPSFGCTDNTALNYDPNATMSNFDCVSAFTGCTDSNAFTFDAIYNVHDQDLCVHAVSGCTVEQSINHDPAATIDDGSCVHKFSGCTDANASNFDAAANWDDGSCRPIVEGCVMLEALNYNPNATYMASEASCVFPVYGCTDSTSINFISQANVACAAYGADPLAPCARFAEGSPSYLHCRDAIAVACPCTIYGCRDPDAINYDYRANVDDFASCRFPRFGCRDPSAANYMSEADYSDPQSPCLFVRYGCKNSTALNYDPQATLASACTFPLLGCAHNAEALNH